MKVTEATLNLMKTEARVLADKQVNVKKLIVWNVTEEGTACDFDIVDIDDKRSDYPDDAISYLVFPSSFKPGN